MNLDYILLAEAAAAGEGKQFLHGAGLRRIDAPQIPFVAQAAIALRFTASLEEAGDRHVLQIRLVQPSGEQLFETPPLQIDVPSEVGQPDSDELGINMAVEGSFPFQQAGWHVFHVSLDEEPLAELRLRVVLNEQAAAQARESGSPD